MACPPPEWHRLYVMAILPVREADSAAFLRELLLSETRKTPVLVEVAT